MEHRKEVAASPQNNLKGNTIKKTTINSVILNKDTDCSCIFILLWA